MAISVKADKLLFLSALPGVGAKTLLSLVALERDVFDAPYGELLSFVPSIKKKVSADEIAKAEVFAKRNMDAANQFGHRIVTIFDDDYPELLRGIPDAPAVLFCSGDVSVLKKKSVAVIGTREPTQHGERIAERITSWFTLRDWTIVSGLAKGIDSIGHKACIEYQGKTAAILAHGLEKIYPAENKGLAKEIVDKGGVLVSEYAYNSPTFKTNFVQRDRIQAALSAAVILVQTDIKGGSLHASKAALKYSRNLIVAGQSSFDVESGALKAQGNLQLLSKGEGAFSELFNDSKLNGELLIKLFSKDDFERAEGQVLKNINSNNSAHSPSVEIRASALL